MPSRARQSALEGSCRGHRGAYDIPGTRGIHYAKLVCVQDCAWTGGADLELCRRARPYCFFMCSPLLLYSVAHLERSCAENFWPYAVAGKNGKPLVGAALNSFLKKCKREACLPKAVSAEGKKPSGAAKNSFMRKVRGVPESLRQEPFS